MSNTKISEKTIAETEALIHDALKTEFTLKDSKALNFPGAETLLILLVSKVIVPIVVSVAGKVAYDKVDEWRKGKNKITSESLLKEANSSESNKPPVEKEKVIQDIVDDLKTEGIDEAKAREFAEKAYGKLLPGQK